MERRYTKQEIEKLKKEDSSITLFDDHKKEHEYQKMSEVRIAMRLVEKKRKSLKEEGVVDDNQIRVAIIKSCELCKTFAYRHPFIFEHITTSNPKNSVKHNKLNGFLELFIQKFEENEKSNGTKYDDLCVDMNKQVLEHYKKKKKKKKGKQN